MKTIRFILSALLLTASLNLFAQTELEAKAGPAIDLLNKAALQAKQQNKKVLLMFHASWCVWCRKMDSALNDPSCKVFFDNNFVTLHITVLESKGNKNLENPGGEEMLKKYNGENQGLPYWAILNSDKKLLFDSQQRTKGKDGSVKAENIGCPASQPEVDYFISLLKKTTNLTDPQLAIIAKRFRENEK